MERRKKGKLEKDKRLKRPRLIVLARCILRVWLEEDKGLRDRGTKPESTCTELVATKIN